MYILLVYKKNCWKKILLLLRFFRFVLFLKVTASEGADPERMYKLVLAGDAAVGKSSFILRLCRNKFHNALNSTLGM